MPKYIFRREELPATEITEKEIGIKVTSDLARRVASLERKKIMRDEMKGIIDSLLNLMFAYESYQDMRNYIDVTNNLAKRVLKEISMVYKDAPTRTVTPKGGEKRYNELTNSETGFNLNGRLQRCNYLLNGLNDLLLQVAVVGDFIDIHTYTPDMVSVFENPDNPAVLDALMIEDYFIDETGKKIQQWIFWSPTRHFIVDSNNRIKTVAGNEDMLNPFRDINIQTGMFYPFIDIHSSSRENAFWDQYSGTDLFEASKLLAIQDTFKNFMVPMQFKQIAVQISGVDDGKVMKSNQIKSPLHILTSNGTISVLDWQSNIQQLGETIQNKMMGIAGNYGVSPDNFKLTAQAQSGFARLVSKERLMEVRQDQVEIWRDIEVRLFDAIKVVNNFYPYPPIPENAKFNIDFVEPRNLEDPQVELNVAKQKLELGLINLYDLVRKENPDIETDEEADAYIKKNIELRNSLKQRFNFDFSALLGGQNGQGETGTRFATA